MLTYNLLRLTKEIKLNQVSARSIVMIALFAALTSVGAWLSIPIKPVPFTLQLFFVLLAGATLGARDGALSQVIYLLLGIAGLPVFAGGHAGLGSLLGPTGGYLIGFVLAALVVGFIAPPEYRNSYPLHLIAMLVGLLTIYLPGLFQLHLIAKLSWSKTLIAGLYPFILFDLIKVVIAARLAIIIKKNPTFTQVTGRVENEA